MSGKAYMKLPHDLSGAMAKNRFKNEMLWGIHKILELYAKEEKFYVVFDYVCDIEVHLENGKYEFYQIKTANSGESYTQAKLLMIGKKEKSVLAKLYILKENFEEGKDKIKLAIVANKPFKDKNNKLYNSIEKLDLKDLEPKVKESIENALKEELKIDKMDFNDISFIYTTMDLLNPKNTLTGEIVNFFNDILKVQIKKPVALYNVLLDKISQKAEYEFELGSYDELIDKKAISKETITEIFEKHIELSNNAVEKSKELIQELYQDNYGKKLKMKNALASIVQKLNFSSELKKREQEIIEYINKNIEILNDSFGNIISRLYEIFKDKFNMEYSEEEVKSFLVLILMKREEEMYE